MSDVDDASLILSIDQGTTGSTALLVDRSGEVVARGYREIACRYPRPGWVEQDAEDVWHRTLEAVADARRACRQRRLAAIGIANQRETTVLWDAATSRPIAPAIVWQCRRTAEICEELRARGLSEEIARRTGLVIDPYFSATKLSWLLNADPSWRARAGRGEIRFGTIDSWLLWKLSGGTVHRTDDTNASRTLLFNLEERRWDPALLELFGVPVEMLPEVCPSSFPFASTRSIELPDGTDLPAGIPIAGVAGDQQAALVGQACFDSGMVKCTYGTGAFLLMNTGDVAVRSRSGLLTTLAFGRDAASSYALEGSVFVAGAAVQWLRDELGLIDRAAESEDLARQAPDNGGVYLVPAFVGLGAPYWDPRARGAIVGLTRGTGRSHLARAALEAIAYQTRDVVDAMAVDSSGPPSELRIDGGAAANNFLAQFQADVLDTTVVRPRITETTALGAAYLAGLAVGTWSSTDELSSLWHIDRRFEPSISDEQRAKLYSGWKEAVRRVRTNEP
ncbi:MAG TPA: glycerol kinase GlpK [Chloroflexota bacterium]|nr:glycerol kinase GlpK [Chloroflexota bacterium]